MNCSLQIAALENNDDEESYTDSDESPTQANQTDPSTENKMVRSLNPHIHTYATMHHDILLLKITFVLRMLILNQKQTTVSNWTSQQSCMP